MQVLERNMKSINFVFLVSVAATLLLSAIDAYQSYRKAIPNGYRVYNPCPPYRLIIGVGHVNKQGRGERNPFGHQFAEEDYEWTPELCRADSDNDGLTNGYELGDPYCVWKKGDTPARQTNISSPGISNKCY